MTLTSRFFVQFTIGLLVVGFLALFAIIGMTIWLGDRAQGYFNEVIEARDMRSSAVELRNAVQLAESSQRGFLVTGNEIYLAPYGTARSIAYRQLDNVTRSLAPYQEKGPAVQRMAKLVSEKFSEMDETIALKRARKDPEALSAFRTNRGKALMDEANVFFSAVIQSADDRLTVGVSEHTESKRCRGGLASRSHTATLAACRMRRFDAVLLKLTKVIARDSQLQFSISTHFLADPYKGKQTYLE